MRRSGYIIGDRLAASRDQDLRLRRGVVRAAHRRDALEPEHVARELHRVARAHLHVAVALVALHQRDADHEHRDAAVGDHHSPVRTRVPRSFPGTQKSGNRYPGGKREAEADQRVPIAEGKGQDDADGEAHAERPAQQHRELGQRWRASSARAARRPSGRAPAPSAARTLCRSRAGRPRSCRGPARRAAADTACRGAPRRTRRSAARCSRAASFRATPARSRRRGRCARVRQAYSASEPPITTANRPRMKMPRFGSVANACTEVSTPERTRKVPSSDSENAMIASSTVQLLERAALLGHGERMDQRGADEPGHERGVLHRVPEPPAAPAELVVGPAAAQRDAEGEEDHATVVHGRDQRAQAASSRPGEQRRDRERERDREADVAHVEHRRVDHHARVLQQRIEVAAVRRRPAAGARTGWR